MYEAILHCVMFCQIILNHVISCLIIFCHIVLCHVVIVCIVVLYYLVLCCVEVGCGMCALRGTYASPSMDLKSFTIAMPSPAKL